MSYLTAAAGKSTTIVVPVCPAAPGQAYEAFKSQAGVMRLLNELCAYIALLRQNLPAQYGAPPEVGNIGIAGLSAGMQNSLAVISTAQGIYPYSDGRWTADSAAFRKKWKEFWSFDAAFSDVKDPRTNKVKVSGRDQFHGFLNACAIWVQQQDDRHLRIYKSDYTAGANVGKQWDPRLEPKGKFQEMVKSANRVQSSNSPWAVSVCDARRRFQCISVSEEFLRDPNDSTGPPEIPEGAEQFKKKNPKVEYKFYHDAIPRIFFGHAMLSSGFR